MQQPGEIVRVKTRALLLLLQGKQCLLIEC